MPNYDVIVIGSGPGGYKAAVSAAHLGARVAIIEKGDCGGICLNQGCIPKKTLLYQAGLLEDIKALQGHGFVGQVSGDFAAALRYKDKVVTGLREGIPLWLRRLGIVLIKGQAQFISSQTIKVVQSGKQQILTAPRVIIATGSSPRTLGACPVDGKYIIDSKKLLLGQYILPKRILLVGGGAIGCEFAYLLHQFGAQVTLVEQTERLLNKPVISERASRELQLKLERLGVTVLTNHTVVESTLRGECVSVKFLSNLPAHLHQSNGLFDQILVAVGRKPHTQDLALSKAGIAVDEQGFIITNDYLETSVPGIYAVGDVKAGPMTANAALHDAKIAAENAVKNQAEMRNYNRVPLVIDSALEIAAVGLTETRAEAAGFEPEVARLSFNASAKARGRNDTEGFIEVVHDEETGQLLGGCIVGAEAGEQIQMLTAACQSQKGLWFLKEINYSHPSWCEELENAIDPYTTELVRSNKPLFKPGLYAPPKS